MKTFKLYRRQVLPITLEESWAFFSTPVNLSEITPPELGLKMRGEAEPDTYNGMMIKYDVHPLFKFPITWVTEIKHVNRLYFFVDEQRFGPYKFWYHQHRFRAVEGGTEVIDEVHYGLWFGFLSGLIDKLYIRGQLDHIFDYRADVLRKKFGEVKDV